MNIVWVFVVHQRRVSSINAHFIVKCFGTIPTLHVSLVVRVTIASRNGFSHQSVTVAMCHHGGRNVLIILMDKKCQFMDKAAEFMEENKLQQKMHNQNIICTSGSLHTNISMYTEVLISSIFMYTPVYPQRQRPSVCVQATLPTHLSPFGVQCMTSL